MDNEEKAPAPIVSSCPCAETRLVSKYFRVQGTLDKIHIHEKNLGNKYSIKDFAFICYNPHVQQSQTEEMHRGK